MSDPRRTILKGALALAWLAAAVALYYFTHSPLSPQAAVGIFAALRSLGVAGLVLSAAGGLGRRLSPDLALPGPAAAVVQAALGLGLWGLLILGLGVSVGFNLALAWGLMALAWLMLWRPILAWWRTMAGGLRALGQGGRAGLAIAGLLIVIFGFGLLAALAPPLRYDALVYHLTLPAEYLAAGRVFDVPHNVYSGFPQNLHMLYWWALALGAARPAVLSWGIGALAALGLWAFAAERLSPRAAWVGLAALLAGYSPAAALGWGYVDWAGVLFGLALLLSLAAWQERPSGCGLWLSGLLGGLMLGVKFTSGALLLPAFVWLATRRPSRAALQGALAFGLAAAAAVAPWLLKNWAFTGNPLYPLLFPAGAMSATRLDFLQGGAVRGGWADLLLLPVRATYWGVELGQVGNAPGYEASMGALLLGLGALAAFNLVRLDEPARRARALAGWLGGGGLAVFTIAARLGDHLAHTHLYYALFAPLALLAACGFYQLARLPMPGVRLGRLAAALVVLALGLNVIEVSIEGLGRGAPAAALGLTAEQRYLEDNLGMFGLVNLALRELLPGSRTLMLWEARSYYCRPLCTPDDLLARWPDDWRRERDPAAALAGWRAEGFTHLLVFHGAADFLRQNDSRITPAEWQAHDDLLADLTLAADFNGFYRLYLLSAP